MNKKDLDNLIRWAVDTDGIKFAKEIYGRSGDYDDENSTDEYTRGKFAGMQKNLIHWIANLDPQNRQHLADAINNNPTNEYEEPKDFNQHKEKYKEFYRDINNILGDMVAVGSKNND
tara:strand:+ start:57 stop:407 length:351 start_codon:yes stop_codon:yes gene_type:complete